METRRALPAVPALQDAAAYSRLLDQLQVGLCILAGGKLRYANARMAELHGYTVAEMAALPVHVLIHRDDRPRVAEGLRQRLAGVPGRPYDVRAVRKDGSLYDARLCGQLITFAGEAAVLATVMDVSETRQAMRAAEWRAGMLQQTEALCRSGSIDVDLLAGNATLSSGMWALLGVAEPPLEPLPIHALLRWLPEDERERVASMWRQARLGEPFELQHRMVRADGQVRVVLHRALVERGPDGRARRTIAIVRDITEQRDAEHRVQMLANFDELTCLPNRGRLLERAGQALAAARPQGSRVALIALQVDQMQQVKDSLGFPAADALAIALANRLQAACTGEDLLARLGPGEFALLADPARSEETAVLALVRAMQAALEPPVSLGKAEVALTASIGVGVFPDDAGSAQSLLQVAETAMGAAAESPGPTVCFFTAQAHARATRRLAVEFGLRHAVQRGELSLHFQPQVDLRTGEMVGAEALLRWHHPALGDIPPAEFVPIAEQCGAIVPIGEWVLREACRHIVSWQRDGNEPLRVTVNLSARQLEQPDVVQRIRSVLGEAGVDPAYLGIEITETAVAADVGHAARMLTELRDMGVKVALDDFGTGYSNLSQLRALPIDLIKIDRSFVHDVTASPGDVSVTRAVIRMAHSLQFKVLAEGVETEGQLALLAEHGCDQVQGYVFSEPVTAIELHRMMREARRLPARFVERQERRRTLLLVDDEENIVASLRRLLRRDGYRIVSAASGAEGLQRLAEAEVDVIVSDQRMPGMTGVEFLRRAKEIRPNTVRIVLSGYTELQAITDAVNEGAIYKFLTKPWDDARLRSHIEEAFRHKEMADDNRRLDLEVQSTNRELAAVNQRLERLLLARRGGAAAGAAGAGPCEAAVAEAAPR
jgi:diguanylate cyclase (GGDEF)-like protein/PAS domain S-box-containing protein